MPGPNGALVPGPGGNHSSAQNNQSIDHEAANQGNLGRGFDQGNAAFAQGNLGQGFDTTTGAGYGSGTRLVLMLTTLASSRSMRWLGIACGWIIPNKH